MTYFLDNSRFHQYGPEVVVVGCGGTGGFVADGLCRLLMDVDAHIVLVDYDRVEEHNLRRQNFFREDLGEYKAKALAYRLTKYGRAVGYSLNRFDRTKPFHSAPALLIGCVDNHLAREAITSYVADATRRVMAGHVWWLDVGNGDHWGQVLVGNCAEPGRTFHARLDLVQGLPLPSIQQPGLLQVPDLPLEEGADCAVEILAGDQSPTINQAMASLVLEFVRRLWRGELSWMGAYLDLEHGLLRTVDATPENAARSWGVKRGSLISQRRSI